MNEAQVFLLAVFSQAENALSLSDVWENKWKIAVEMAAIAENKLDQERKNYKDLVGLYNSTFDKLVEAEKKLDKIEEIL